MKQTLYEQDYQLWIDKTIEQLKQREFVDLDFEHLIEELIDLGKSEKKSLESNLMILLAHLLKLKVQAEAPDTMKNSWYNSVDEHRKRVLIDLKETPSLKNYLTIAIEKAYQNGRDLAIKEGKRGKYGVQISEESNYPIVCPFLIEQILYEDFYFTT
ncbi:DUF29 domain-containing protein [Aphanothece hegewaldii CCALA 016]|uniref:DUF29 domain-containing protein n=1 Tax=Aphanothece hegewaldii CCALA 016 TaxID=2107694 RepID=A0A2T1LTZ2_9CHRO|nr:DUF29 domain-containing protein [Aphanothece hegewaldii]PSF34595.1 DUF29 domain-containing protein [Aphanothece hegewaldii CCALA 016]